MMIGREVKEISRLIEIAEVTTFPAAFRTKKEIKEVKVILEGLSDRRKGAIGDESLDFVSDEKLSKFEDSLSKLEPHLRTIARRNPWPLSAGYRAKKALKRLGVIRDIIEDYRSGVR